MSSQSPKQKVVLVGIAGSYNAFSLSLYNLKAYAMAQPDVAGAWDLDVVQIPYLSPARVDEVDKIEAIADDVLSRGPRVVGVSTYMWNRRALDIIAARIKERAPDVLLVWGGPEISRDYIVEGLYDDLVADYLVSGEGERTFTELLRHLVTGTPAAEAIDGMSYRGADQRFIANKARTPFRSIAEIPSPYLNGIVDEDVLTRPKLEANLETQRGCTLRCSYCIYHKDMAKIAYSDVDRVRDEVLYVLKRGVKKLRFVDANFSSDLDFAKSVMRALIAEKIEAKLMFELIPGWIDEELASLFGEYQELHPWNEMTLGIGVQTINLAVLKKMRRKIKVDRFEMTFDLLEKHGIYAKIDLIVGLPGEDIHSISRTLEYFLDRLRNSRAHLLCCHVMRGLPGTELLDIAERYEMMFSSRNEPHELIESPILPRAHMLKVLRRTGLIFRLVNHHGWTQRAFLTGKHSTSSSIRDAFFGARDRLGASNLEVIDLLEHALMPALKERGSVFADPDFPRAESWWWGEASQEITNDMIVEALDGMNDTDLARLRQQGLVDPPRVWRGTPLPVLQ